MAKKKTAKTTRATQRSSASATPPAFISANDLTGRTKYRILPSISVYERGTESSLFINIENQKHETFTWGVRLSSPDRISLQQRFGRNLLDWPDKVIELVPIEGSRGGRFVNLYDPDRSQPHRSRPNDDDVPF